MNELSVAEYQENVLAIEQSRAIQEVQAQMVIAKKFRRDEIAARAKIIKACERKSLAEVAEYVFPRGGTQITGPSIRIAEVIARYWENINYGLIEMNQVNGTSDVIAFAWDLETNVKATRQFKVSHRRKAHGSFTDLVDPREIYEHVASQGQRRVRACILEIIPGDVVDEALEVCQKTLKSGHDEPLADRIVKMVSAFDKFGVSKDMIEARLGHPMDSTIEQELINLRKIYTSIKDGIGKREDFFSLKAEPEKPKTLDGEVPKAGGEDPYKTTKKETEPELFQCPYCDHKPYEKQGWLDSHIEKQHKNEKERDEKGQTGSPENQTGQQQQELQSAWANEKYWLDNIMPWQEELGPPTFNLVLSRFDGAKGIDEVPIDKRKECWLAMSKEADKKNE